ncbi:hypothetical protein AK830_g8781 [Neonectria ditissima]|uniref:Uncharacterized protein n=1 Tax=Neonectria ditissima TaxID=78410 RepID=A0A0P7AT89_9HYPO|nr:hypothetical protein AK830_g8781 [Neonectria ditissima]
MRFFALAAVLLGATTTVLTAPANERRNACCCCDVSIPAIICQEIDGDDCNCPSVVCPAGAPIVWDEAARLPQVGDVLEKPDDDEDYECCCCDPTVPATVCERRSAPEDCICLAVACPEDAPTLRAGDPYPTPTAAPES